MSEEPIRAAATVVLWRMADDQPQVLMGQRGAGAAFMPSKYVFPGGRVEQDDAGQPAPLLGSLCLGRLSAYCAPDAPSPQTLAAAARRELIEETGLAPAPDAPWRFIFRAITPPGRSRRFDARFFLVPAAGAMGDAEGFTGAEDELSHLHWIGLSAARVLDLPFITEVVLAEVAALLAGQDQPGVPFFDNSGPAPTFRRIP